MSQSSNWWYSVALFPLSVAFSLVSLLGVVVFSSGLDGSLSDGEVLVSIAAFAVSMLSNWTGILLSLLVLLTLGLDVRALRRSGDESESEAAWMPSYAWVLAGVVHLAGSVFWVLFVVSVPLLSFYLYRRGLRVGAPASVVR